jgi:hypothetical protein
MRQEIFRSSVDSKKYKVLRSEMVSSRPTSDGILGVV